MMENAFIKRIVTAVISILLVVYIGFQVYRAEYTPIKSEPVHYSTIDDSINATGYIFRDETVIYNNSNGVLRYLLNDGDKISSGGVVAEIYENESDVVNNKEIENIDNEINKLQQLSYEVDSFSTNIDSVNKQIFQELKTISLSNNDNHYLSISENHRNILYLVNEGQVITGDSSGLSDRISKLKEKKEEIISKCKQCVGTVNSPSSGYFVNKIDGYEKFIDFSNINNIKPTDLTNFAPNISNDSSINGKIINGLNWYTVCVIKADKAMDMSVGQSLNITFPFASFEEIPCKITAINYDNKKENAAIVMKCNYMSNELSVLRNEPVQLKIKSYSGLRINKKSLHEDIIQKKITDEKGNESVINKKVQGVYTLYGSELIFKQVVPVYANNNYIICDESPDENSLVDGQTIGLYDEVVVEGSNLYNGKVIG